jgi:hypothetical protein
MVTGYQAVNRPTTSRCVATRTAGKELRARSSASTPLARFPEPSLDTATRVTLERLIRPIMAGFGKDKLSPHRSPRPCTSIFRSTAAIGAGRRESPCYSCSMAIFGLISSVCLHKLRRLNYRRSYATRLEVVCRTHVLWHDPRRETNLRTSGRLYQHALDGHGNGLLTTAQKIEQTV